MASKAWTDTLDFDAYYVGSVRRVFRQIALLTGDVAEAEDVRQEAFERAWSRWAEVRDCSSTGGMGEDGSAAARDQPVAPPAFGL